jgi:16S rRNA (uracil1498-N3)-methyltransferase
LIAHCEETDKKTLKSVLKAKESVTLLIGPGDFSRKKLHWQLKINMYQNALNQT